MRFRVIVVLLAAAAVCPVARADDDGPKLTPPTPDERKEYVRRARVWEPVEIASQDLYNGRPGTLTFAVDQEVTCTFLPKPMTGLTEKFLCTLDDGRVIKVKYNDGKRFKEAYGEVLGTRLFAALGFYADKMLPVRVTCRECPRQPWKYVRAKKVKKYLDAEGMIRGLPPEAEVGTHTFDPAAIEEQLDAETIESKQDEGWSWKSLKHVDPAAGGAEKAELDALKLLMAFVQNSDNKSKQNTLACLNTDLVEDASGRVTCRKPILFVDDLGSVFGRGGFVTGYKGRVNYEGWKKRRIWRDADDCRARLIAIGGIFRKGTLRNPKIGEAGRKHLAELLAALSDEQIADLFRGARIERLRQTIEYDDEDTREVTVEDWVAVFKEKRDQIVSHPGCTP